MHGVAKSWTQMSRHIVYTYILYLSVIIAPRSHLPPYPALTTTLNGTVILLHRPGNQVHKVICKGHIHVP